MNTTQIISRENLVELCSERLRVTVEPALGGKIRSFLSLQSGFEHLFQDQRPDLAGDSYDHHDFSGFDECFPTVGVCSYPEGSRKGRPLGDHGLLWSGPWESRIEEDRVVMIRDLPELECLFQRSCRLENPTTLRLNYIVNNYGDEPLKFIYAGHILPAAGPDSQLVLPPEMNRVYLYGVLNIPGLEKNTWREWPPPAETGLTGRMSGERDSAIKFFSDKLTAGRAAIYHHDRREGLRIEYDASALPYLGVMIAQGYDLHGDGLFKGVILPGLEPTNAVGDDLPTAQATGTLRQLDPGNLLNFWIRLSLFND
jgi:hypothetical protein